MSSKRRVPAGPIAIEDVIERFPTLRQSLLASFDDCPLSAFFELRYANGWSTHPQARGTLFHRYAAEVLRTMQRQKHETIPVYDAEQILIEVCRQQDVEPRDIVRLPMRQMPELRMVARKFAKDNRFSTGRIVDVERRMEAPITYTTPGGLKVERRLTGQLDALLFAPPDGAIVIDWKASFGIPPKAKTDVQFENDELKGLSYHGYFQQRFYGWLVMSNYRNVERVTLREFYPYKTQVRKATLHRGQLGEVEEELSILAQAFDAAVGQGSPAELLKGDGEGYVDIDSMGWWKPQPGKHCGFCTRAAACPIEEDVREGAGAAASSSERARRLGARLKVLDRLREQTIEACKGYVETAGAPIPVKYSKGRLVLGWFQQKGGGRRFGFHTPEDSDRGAAPDVEAQMAEAMREATSRAKAEAGIRPRRRGGKA